ncbi:MAG: hypothetical protein SRB2_02134 [Desulfobacteraceae bacterium Eth-SRB2]|nr:MAG: hypothetical protein SRB2_02134 [Desulfobacteraceae bacterium Eth-SRB2]
MKPKLPKSQNTLPGFSQNSTEPYYLKTYDDLADFFGVHTQTIKNWSRRGMPKAARGKYDANAIKVWAVKENLIENDNIGYSAKIQKEKYLHERAKRREREFELAVKTGKFIKIEDAKKELITLAQQIRMNILALPHKMAPLLEDLTASQIQKKLEVAVDEVLRHLSYVEKK